MDPIFETREDFIYFLNKISTRQKGDECVIIKNFAIATAEREGYIKKTKLHEAKISHENSYHDSDGDIKEETLIYISMLENEVKENNEKTKDTT